MSYNCVCDGPYPSFYHTKHPIARKAHRCDECCRAIRPGEKYERVTANWEGVIGTYKTCPRCLALREYVKAHVPCFCWYHTNMIEDALGTAHHYAHEAPGLLFRAYRLQVAIKRAPRVKDLKT